MAAEGDRIAVREFIERYGSLVWSLARRARLTDDRAEEVVNDVFADVWKTAAAFDPNALSEATFVAMIARRHIIDRRRSNPRKPQLEGFNDVLRVPPADLGSETVDAARVIAELTPEERQALVMTACQSLTLEEVAQSMKTEVAPVRAHAQRALLRVCGARADRFAAPERLVSLLTDRVLVGLGPADEDEIARLLVAHAAGDAFAREVEVAAASVAIAAASARGIYPLPSAVLARVENAAHAKLGPETERSKDFDDGRFPTTAKTGTRKRLPSKSSIRVDDRSSEPKQPVARERPASSPEMVPKPVESPATPRAGEAAPTKAAEPSDEAPATTHSPEPAKTEPATPRPPDTAPPPAHKRTAQMRARPPSPSEDPVASTTPTTRGETAAVSVVAALGLAAPRQAVPLAAPPSQTRIPTPGHAIVPPLRVPTPANAIAPQHPSQTRMPTPANAMVPVRPRLPSDPGSPDFARSASVQLPSQHAFRPVPLAATPAARGPLAAAGWIAAGMLGVLLVVVVTLQFRAPPAATIAVSPLASAITQTAASVAPDAPLPTSERDALIARGNVLRLAWARTKDTAGRQATGDLVWSAAEQRGFLRIHGLAKSERKRSVYQLFIADALRDERYPVDCGTFDIDDENVEFVIPFKPKLPVAEATAFSISLEKAGGVVVSNRAHVVLTASAK